MLIGAAKSPTRIGLPDFSASVPGPWPSVACKSSTALARESVTYTGSNEFTPPVTIRPAPLTPTASTHARQACLADMDDPSRCASNAIDVQSRDVRLPFTADRSPGPLVRQLFSLRIG